MGGIFDSGKDKRAGEESALQKDRLREQEQKEKLRAAEAEDETARRKTIAKKGGVRSSLLVGSESGVASQTATGNTGMKPKTSAKMGG